MSFKEKSLQQVKKAVLPMAGPGTRLRPFTYAKPKHMINIAGKPLIEYVLKTLHEAGIREVGLVVHYKKEQIIDQLGDGSKWGLCITYIAQDQLRGVADAVLCSEHFVDKDPFIVYLPDTLIPKGIKDHVRRFIKSRSDALILAAKLSGPKLFSAGTVQVVGKRVIKLEEKSPHPRSNLALAGVYLFKSPNVFNMIKKIKPSKRGELEITDAIQRLVDEGYVVHNQTIQSEYIDAGSHRGLLQANRYILSRITPLNEGKLEEGAVIEGKVQVHQGTLIRKDSCIHGPVYIGKNCYIGLSTSIGPYVSIDDDTTIQGGAVKDSIIMKQSQLSLRGTLSKSVVGRNVKMLEEGKANLKEYKLILGDNSVIEF